MDLPYLNTIITPQFLDDGSASSLNISMIYEIPNVKAGEVLLTMTLVAGWISTAAYREEDIKASDNNGPILLKIEDVDNNQTRNFLSLRDTVGDLKIEFQALPREVTKKTLPAPRVDLRTDQGGLIGNGVYFIPIIADKQTIYNINVKWDLELAPKGTKAVWSFGDGESTNRIGLAKDLISFYAVGPLNSYSSSIKEPNDFGVYWFGEPPFDANQLSVNVEKLYVDMQEFFKEEEESTFRVFLRKSIHNSFGGTGGARSFLFEFADNFTKLQIDDLAVLNVLAHEIVHEYPLMEEDMTDEAAEYNTGWFSEGIAVYYAAILPYLSNSYNRADFIQMMNSMTSAYYTSPAINMSEKEAAGLVATDSHAQRLPYFRGAMYFVKLDAELRVSSNGQRSLTDLILPFLNLKRQRKPYGFKQWLGLLENILGESAIKDVYDLLEGKKLIIPPTDSMAYAGLKLVKVYQEAYEHGIRVKDATVIKVIPGTRAAKSGIQEGDIVEEMTPLYLCADNFSRSIKAKIRRRDEIKEFSYWPRTWEKVESYEWISVDDDKQ